MISNVSEWAGTLAVQPDGKIVVTGAGNKLVRFNSNGTLDGSFGSNGSLTTDFPVTKILMQTDGKIITGGGLNGNFAIARYKTNGTPDFDSGAAEK